METNKMMKKKAIYSKLDLISQETYEDRKQKHKEIRDKNSQIRKSLNEDECELDLTQLDDK